MSPSGLVVTRFVNDAPAPFVDVFTTFAPTSRSVGLVVVTAPLLLDVPVPCAATVTSTGLAAATPLYSAIRTSGYGAEALKVTRHGVAAGRRGGNIGRIVDARRL